MYVTLVKCLMTHQRYRKQTRSLHGWKNCGSVRLDWTNGLLNQRRPGFIIHVMKLKLFLLFLLNLCL